MTSIAIEISDVGLEAAAGSGAVGSPSPGYVLLDRHDLVAGEAARSEARLRPRFVRDRHWDLMNLQPAGRPFPRGLSQADLVHAHLTQYWASLAATLQTPLAGASVVFAVPASYSVDQLSLLLGVARSGEIGVKGLVDSALASLAGLQIEGRALHLDIRLHRSVWTVIDSADRMARSAVESVESAGLASFRNAWVRLLADQFVRETRFDPLHRGASEQSLYDRLDGWVSEIEDEGSAVISIDAGGDTRTVEITDAQLEAAASRELDAVVEAADRLRRDRRPSAIYLSSRAADVPGLISRLAEIAVSDPIRLSAGAAARGALKRRDSIESPGAELPLIIDLPVLEAQGSGLDGSGSNGPEPDD